MPKRGYIVVGKDGCVFCEKAVALLENENRPYLYVNVHEKNNLEQLRKLLPEVRLVPQIFDADGNHVGGFEELEAKLSKEELENGD